MDKKPYRWAVPRMKFADLFSKHIALDFFFRDRRDAFAVYALVVLFRGWRAVLWSQPHQGGQVQLGLKGGPAI